MKLTVEIGVSGKDEGDDYVALVKQAGIPGLKGEVRTYGGRNGQSVVALTMNTVQQVKKTGQVSAVAS